MRAHDGESTDPAPNAHVSFEEFYAAHRDRVGRALAMTLGDPQLAVEAVDEAMARAFQRWPQVSSMANPTGWVYRVGINWAMSLTRRLRRRAPSSVAVDTAIDASVADPSIDVALGELTHAQRAVVVCRLLLGLSEAQTADALGIRPGTVKSRLARATQLLSTSLAPLDPRLDRTEHQP